MLEDTHNIKFNKTLLPLLIFLHFAGKACLYSLVASQIDFFIKVIYFVTNFYSCFLSSHIIYISSLY